MAIDMCPVSSTAIKALGHDPATGVVHVEFHSGGTHLFGPFTAKEFGAFLAADSIGKHFHAYVRAKAMK